MVPGPTHRAGVGRGSPHSWHPRLTGAPAPQGSLLQRQMPAFLNGFFQNSEQVVVRVMGTVSDVLHRLGANGAAAQSLRVAINARSFFDDVSVPRRRRARALLMPPSCAYPRSSKAEGPPPTPLLPAGLGAGERSPKGGHLGVHPAHLGRTGPTGRQVALGPFSTRLEEHRRSGPPAPPAAPSRSAPQAGGDCLPSLGS